VRSLYLRPYLCRCARLQPVCEVCRKNGCADLGLNAVTTTGSQDVTDLADREVVHEGDGANATGDVTIFACCYHGSICTGHINGAARAKCNCSWMQAFWAMQFGYLNNHISGFVLVVRQAQVCKEGAAQRGRHKGYSMDIYLATAKWRAAPSIPADHYSHVFITHTYS
jgi:hypothetical protein